MSAPRFLAPLALAGLPACATSLSLAELDALARTVESRTVVLERDVSIYSPYSLVWTRQYLDLVRLQRDEVFGILGVEPGSPVIVWLRPDEGMTADVEVHGDGFRVNSLGRGPEDHVLGQADASVVQIRVGAPADLELPDGRVVTMTYDPEKYAGTVRHELAHVAMTRLGYSGPDWLSEGVAHALEWLPIADGRFDLAGEAPPRLRAVAKLPADEMDVDAFLDWRQRLPVRDEDGVARSLAFSFVAFVCDTESLTVRAGLRRLESLDRAEVRTLEPAWRSWLARFAS